MRHGERSSIETLIGEELKEMLRPQHKMMKIEKIGYINHGVKILLTMLNLNYVICFSKKPKIQNEIKLCDN
jgi:hypothetical protein